MSTTADYIERLIASAPPLSDSQRDKLAELLRPVRTGADPELPHAPEMEAS